MRKYVRGAIFGFCALLVGIQFIRPARTNPPVVEANTLEAKVTVPPAVEQILTTSCKDCHSNETHWPWYSNVAPISWFLINHVNGGRSHMNFSDWPPPKKQLPASTSGRKRQSACDRVQTGDMPLSSYLLIHRGSRLTPENVQTFCQWANVTLQ